LLCHRLTVYSSPKARTNAGHEVER
jgi:hypothetical protein